MIKGIHHVALKCCGKEEFDKTVSFYKDLLGLSVKRTWPGAVMLDTGAGLLEIFDNADSPLPQGALRHIALATDNTDECIKTISNAGYTVTMQPSDVTIPSSPAYPVRIAFCLGPIGEEIEFFQEK